MLWLLAAAAIAFVMVRLVPETYRELVALEAVPEGDRDAMRRALAELHLSPTTIAWYQLIAFSAVGALVNLTIGWLLIRRPPRTGFVCFLAFVLLALTNAVYPPDIDDLLAGLPVEQAITRATTVIAIGGFFTLPFVFPDGRFVPRWTVFWGIYNFAGVATFAFAPSLLPDGDVWTAVEAGMTVLTVISIVISLVYRYRKVSTPIQRRQTRWVVFGLLIGVPGFFLGDAFMRNIDSSSTGIACLLGFLIIMPIATTLPVVTIGIAILNHRLFDIDVILSRTLVWLAMTGAIIGVYAGIVLGVGSLIDARDSVLLSLLATGLVAVAFQPVLMRVRRWIDRMLFGARDDPYAVLSRLGQQIEDTLHPGDLLSSIVRTTAETLRLPYAALFLERPEGPVLAAATGVASPSTLRLPLVYQGQSIGALEVATRTPGEVFGATDRRLLEDLTRQIGVAARTVGLAEDLQHSRERIVASREEERRRLRRDLHDGLGAQLAALIMQAGAARSLVRSDPAAADRELTALREELRGAVGEIRRLVQGLRPPALDELGLLGALRTRLARFDRGGIDAEDGALRVDADMDDALPPLSAATEVAAFRIVEEAVTNVVKHARATRVTVTLRSDGSDLHIAVVDDGVGLGSPGDETGLGLQSIRERATELGGSVAIEAGPNGMGTAVLVSLPISPGVAS
jgi:signal transduction histidine kinase